MACDANSRFESTPAYTVLNRWEWGERVLLLSELDTDEDIFISCKLKKTPGHGARLIIKTKDAGLSVNTLGKRLYTVKAERGERYNIIELEGLKKGGVINMRVVPYKGKHAGVTATPKITTLNDFLFTLICENAVSIIAAAVMGISAVLGAAFALVKRKYSVLYLCAGLIFGGVLVLSMSDVFLFISALPWVRSIFKAVCAVIIPFLLFAFLAEVKTKGKTAVSI